MKQSGLSLIELMVVVLLIGILSLLATPLTGSWINSARVGETLGAMEQAVGQAKAAALRNPAAVQGDVAASVVCVSPQGVLSVRSATPAVPPNPVAAPTCAGGGTVLWTTPLHTSVKIELVVGNVTEAWSCGCFTNKGLLTKTADNCLACSSNLELRVTAGTGLGEEKDDRKFY